MNISGIDSNAFGARFINNKAFREVVEYAEKNNKLQELDSALNVLSNVNNGEIMLTHGEQNGMKFSSFTLFTPLFQRRSVYNLEKASSFIEASYNAIKELSNLGKKFEKLFGNKPNSKLYADNIISKYTVSKLV